MEEEGGKERGKERAERLQKRAEEGVERLKVRAEEVAGE